MNNGLMRHCRTAVCTVALAMLFAFPQTALAEQLSPAVAEAPGYEDAPSEVAETSESETLVRDAGGSLADTAAADVAEAVDADEAAGDVSEGATEARESAESAQDEGASGLLVQAIAGRDEPEAGESLAGEEPDFAPEAIQAQAEQPAPPRAPAASLSVRAHIQNIGWGQGWRTASATADKAGFLSVGTSGQSLRMEALEFQVKGISGGVSCQAHVQNIGWQAAGQSLGTTGRSLRIESVRISLTGELSRWYDVEYRTHVQNDGWKGWSRNGAESGTTGRGLRLEALEVRLVPKQQQTSAGEGIIGVRSWAHVQNVGDTAWVRDGAVQGTTGRSLRVEAMKFQLDKGVYKGGIEYQTHVQNVGWTNWSRDGQLSGTTGRSLRMEAVKIRLTGDIAKAYEVVYRAHVQNVGWQDWVSGDNVAGTTGRSLRVEAIQVQLVRRPSVPTATRTVDDGMYTLSLDASSGNALGVAGASNANGGNVDIEPNNNWRLEDKWIATWKGNGYELANVNSGKVLESAGGASNLVANVRQGNRNNSKAQRWALLPSSGGSFTIAGMEQGAVLTVQDGKLASGSNVHLWSPNGGNSQRFDFNRTDLVYAGVYQVFTKLDQSGKSVAVSGGSLGNNANMVIAASTDNPDQHVVFAKSGDGFTMQVVSSGKYITGSGAKVVQVGKNNADSQVWKPSLSGNGGVVFTNAATGLVLTVQGNRNASGVALQQVGRNDSAGQRWYPAGRSLVSNGLYEFRTAANSSIILDVNGGSFASGTNAMVHTRNGGNNQKFLVTAVSDGYYRISMPLSSTVVSVQGSSKGNGANVRMETWNGSNAQLWKPVVNEGGLVFVNRNSGQALSFASAKAGANVYQSANPGSSAQQKWTMAKTSLNPDDLLTFRMAIMSAPGGRGTTLTNAVPGYSISKARWNELMSALNAIWAQGASVGFVMLDENTGMTVSLEADARYYGASTVKALWVTFLFQEYLEKGRLSWGEVSYLVQTAIADSNNESYLALRSRYGSEAEFSRWLSQVGVRHISTWDYYTPRELALVWTHMEQYSRSNGRYVSNWKSTFNHSYYSAIREGIGGYRTTYSKPGWLPAGGSYPNALDDAAIVDDRNGRRYLVAIMSTMRPYGDREPLRKLARALDAIHMEMPRSR